MPEDITAFQDGRTARMDSKPRDGRRSADWLTKPADNLEEAIRRFKADLPGWWFTVGECEKSCDASCGPTRDSEHIKLVGTDSRFDDGFHVDLDQPSTLAKALYEVSQDAMAALMERKA